MSFLMARGQRGHHHFTYTTTYLETSGFKRTGVKRTVNLRVRLHKEPGMFPVRVAWSAADKRGLHSAGLQPNWDKQAHHSAARLSLLPHPHPHAARQQTGCLSVNRKTHHLSPPTLLFHPPDVDTNVSAVVQCRMIRSHTHRVQQYYRTHNATADTPARGCHF